MCFFGRLSTKMRALGQWLISIFLIKVLSLLQIRIFSFLIFCIEPKKKKKKLLICKKLNTFIKNVHINPCPHYFVN